MSEAYDAAIEIRAALQGIEESLYVIREDIPDLRDWFAMHAMNETLRTAPPCSAEEVPQKLKHAAAICYLIADAMMERRKK